MTTYELAISLPREKRLQMSEAGILSRSIERYIYVYELFVEAIEAGRSKMDAYAEVAARSYTCEENVRKIVQRMQKKA